MNLTKENLHEHVNVDPETGCWIWKHGKIKSGYGGTWHNGKVWRVHRLTWELFKGPIPEGLCVLHRCDNPPCCNPKHLFVGTKGDNTRDAAEKGRMATGSRHGTCTHPETVPRGEKNGASKLTKIAVLEIRRRYQRSVRGGNTQKKLAKEYGVTRQTISDVVQRKRWKHV